MTTLSLLVWVASIITAGIMATNAHKKRISISSNTPYTTNSGAIAWFISALLAPLLFLAFLESVIFLSKGKPVVDHRAVATAIGVLFMLRHYFKRTRQAATHENHTAEHDETKQKNIFWLRVGAGSADCGILFAINGLCFMLYSNNLTHSYTLGAVVFTILWFGAQVARGSSPGQMLFNLQTVRRNTSKPAFYQLVAGFIGSWGVLIAWILFYSMYYTYPEKELWYAANSYALKYTVWLLILLSTLWCTNGEGSLIDKFLGTLSRQTSKEPRSSLKTVAAVVAVQAMLWAPIWESTVIEFDGFREIKPEEDAVIRMYMQRHAERDAEMREQDALPTE